MSDEAKPAREWWIDRFYQVWPYPQQDEKTQMAMAEHAVHVIEYSAVERLEAQLLDAQNKWGEERAELNLALLKCDRLEKALREILHGGNMATQGKWDEADKMKNIAYAALVGE